MKSNMTVLKIMPGHKPERIAIPHTLEAMQAVVGGYIQAVYPFEEPVAIVCNEEGKIFCLEPNRAIRDPGSREILDVVCGTFFICGLSEDDVCSLTDAQLNYYSELFRYPELFLWNGNNLVILKMDD